MGSGTFRAASANDGGRRAFWPGARWALVVAAVLALALAAVLVLVLDGGGKSRYPAQDLTYGSLPSWLPKSARAPAGNSRLEVATPGKPIFQEEQGYTVQAELPGGSVDITAVGPQFPSYVSNDDAEGRWPNGKLVPSTFYVTFADVRGTIPVAAKDFSVLTDTGVVVEATLRAKGAGTVPTAVHTGQSLTVKVVTKAAEGQGVIRWTPLGPKVLVGWLYQLELD